MTEQKDPREGENRRGLTFGQLMKSVLGAAIGVQTEATRHRDFTHGHPGVFIVAGVVFTAVFVLVLVLIVQMVLSNAGV
jgi:hypothetical protein